MTSNERARRGRPLTAVGFILGPTPAPMLSIPVATIVAQQFAEM